MVGRETGRVPQAQALQAKLDTEWAQVQADVARATRKPRVLFILSHTGSPMAAGQATAADALMKYAGLSNVVTAFEGYRALTAEALASAAPDVIINTKGHSALGGEAAFGGGQRCRSRLLMRARPYVARGCHLLGFGPPFRPYEIACTCIVLGM